MPIKPQILAAISGAISAYIADEEVACQAAALPGGGGRRPRAIGEPLGPGRPQPGHAVAPVDAAAQFEIELPVLSSKLPVVFSGNWELATRNY